jgi:hypothetical protein
MLPGFTRKNPAFTNNGHTLIPPTTNVSAVCRSFLAVVAFRYASFYSMTAQWHIFRRLLHLRD